MASASNLWRLRKRRCIARSPNNCASVITAMFGFFIIKPFSIAITAIPNLISLCRKLFQSSISFGIVFFLNNSFIVSSRPFVSAAIKTRPLNSFKK